MQCPICKKDLEIKNKKIGENEAGEAIYNEFAICRDCKKQWNLDKQREKKKKLAKEALAEKTVEAGKAAEKPHKKRPAAEGEPEIFHDCFLGHLINIKLNVFSCILSIEIPVS